MDNSLFRNTLLDWYNSNLRQLPWRETKNPYFIWLSEIILQQTRVAQGMNYYQKFVGKYPRVSDLASADIDSVLKDWEGLGYYSRARNLHASAKMIMDEYKGIFPEKYEEIIRLKGVGDYTASAISSFAFDEAQAVLDGNVFRFLSRYFGISHPINSGKGQKEFKKLALELLDRDNPAIYNQAIMEFGAIQCVPVNPDCQKCPFQNSCFAFEKNEQKNFPVKIRKVYSRKRYLNYLFLSNEDKIAVVKRADKDIWASLNQFILIESNDQLLNAVQFSKEIGLEISIELQEDLPKHKLSHQDLFIRIFVASGLIPKIDSNVTWVSKEELEKLAFPKPLRSFLDRNELSLRIFNR